MRLEDASEGPLQGILGYSRRPLVSMDDKGDPHSGIVEEEYATVLGGGTLAKCVAWYDNEWGYSCRVSDLAKFMKDKGVQETDQPAAPGRRLPPAGRERRALLGPSEHSAHSALHGDQPRPLREALVIGT